MTLRDVLGGHAQVVHDEIDDLLDSENSLLVLVDNNRMVTYAQGFAASPCQLELLTQEIELAVRAVVGEPSTTTNHGNGSDRQRPTEHDLYRCRAVLRQSAGDQGGRPRSRVTDE
jgi:hypothetical protein